MRYLRVIEILLGLVFVVSAATKALDMNATASLIKAYGVVTTWEAQLAVAFVSVVLEAVLAAAMLASVRVRGWIMLAVLTVLAGFTGLIGYAWLFEGLKDCGCFGKYLSMGPKTSIAKNLVLMALAGAAWVMQRKEAKQADANPEAPLHRPRLSLGVAGMAIVFGAFLMSSNEAGAPQTAAANPNGNPASPFNYTVEYQGQTLDLTKGEYIVAMLNADCPHCQASVAALNEWIDTDPTATQVVALMIGSEEEMEDFHLQTDPHFATLTIEMKPFMELLGNAPPRFYLVRDGAPVRHSDAQELTLDDLTQLVRGDGLEPQGP